MSSQIKYNKGNLLRKKRRSFKTTANQQSFFNINSFFVIFVRFVGVEVAKKTIIGLINMPSILSIFCQQKMNMQIDYFCKLVRKAKIFYSFFSTEKILVINQFESINFVRLNLMS